MESNLQILLREATDSDSELAYKIKKAAFSQYVTNLYGCWDEFEQHGYHQSRFVFQNFKIIIVNGKTAGSLEVVAEPECINVRQLMILPEHQGKGIGAHCMAVIRAEAEKLGVPIRLQVMKVNPRALLFYKRLGFVVSASTDTHYQMEAQL